MPSTLSHLYRGIRWKRRLLLMLVVVMAASSPLRADPTGNQPMVIQSGLDGEAARAAIAFQQALRDGDAEAVRRLLADDVHIYEGKGVEHSADEYAHHHMPGDMAFLKSMSFTPLEHKVREAGDMAYSVAKTRLQGRYKGKDIDLISVETLVLARTGNSWKIVHIHWSHG
ncbi:MAG: nuclear transport factor 2 family protein [Pseudomonadota bacterium]|uniref:YybH family protein n=1 Tax=Gallaecimonas pentaromativorans TaxID=584787 RepID=UPI00067E6A58|nr:nuclear transport factor 2 family protein [Gallaecimonas pentaromativorans]MED5523717.1 nuclear transport factor 2 family protein [Pseudomonadota bacterium]